jgi:GNAT superfamily N-acetyltransferase
MVLPDFQKMGFGTLLSKHCDEISDRAGCRTFIPAALTSVGMFRKLGYRDLLGKEELAVAISFPLCRDPKKLEV